jgi:hypothetical protein
VLDELNAMHEQAFKALLPPELLADLEAARKIWKDDARAVGHSLKECDRGDIDLDPALEVAPDQRTKH